MQIKATKKEKKSLIGKEVVIGVVSIGLGIYGIMKQFGFINYDLTAPAIVGNALLVLGGFFLITQAYRLMRHEYHLRRLF